MLGLAVRIVDDVEILWCLCRVLYRSSPRPSKRRILRALYRTIADDRSPDVSEEKKKAAPLVRRASVAVLSRIFIADEDLFSASKDDHEEREDMANFDVGPPLTKVLEEVALYPLWRSVAVEIVEGSSRKEVLAFGAWCVARLALGGFADLLFLPRPLLLAYRGLLAHPFEKTCLACLSPLKKNHEFSAGYRGKNEFWAGYRGAVFASLLDANLGLAAAPRLKGMTGRAVTINDCLLHAQLSLYRLPRAVAAVVLSRLAALFLFGSSDRQHSLQQRLTRYLGLPKKPTRREKKTHGGDLFHQKTHHQNRHLPAAAASSSEDAPDSRFFLQE